MKELTFETMIAVFEEIFGVWVFWGLVAAAVVITAAYLYVLVRDRAMSARKFLLAQVAMPLTGAAAVWFVLAVTESRLADMGGPIDAIVLLAIFLAGAVGGAILVYTAQALMRREPEAVPDRRDRARRRTTARQRA
jgi:hypothetical protein